MKLTGITGTGTGKLGSSVFAVNAGVQIVRQYQPVVSNPSTAAQVEQRAKLKLASQLARDLKKSIVIPKDGLVSSRNMFMSKNFAKITYENETAEVNPVEIQLTNSSLGMGSIDYAKVATSGNITIMLSGYVAGRYENYVVSVYRRNSGDGLTLIGQYNAVDGTDITPTQNAGEGYLTIAGTAIAAQAGDLIYIYGVNSLNEKARARYTDMVVNSGLTVASLMTSRETATSDYEFSRTEAAVSTANT